MSEPGRLDRRWEGIGEWRWSLWRAERGEEIPRGTIHEGSLDTTILADVFPGRLYYPLGARAVVCLEERRGLRDAVLGAESVQIARKGDSPWLI